MGVRFGGAGCGLVGNVCSVGRAQVGSHEFAGFASQSCLIFGSFGMKLAGSGLWTYTQGTVALFLDLVTRGPSY